MNLNPQTYRFNVGDYYIIYKFHHNGVLVLLSRFNHDYVVNFGLTKSKSYRLYDYEWLEMEEYDDDEDNDDENNDNNEIISQEKYATFLIDMLNGGSIGEVDTYVEFTDVIRQILIAFSVDIASNDDLSWFPNNNMLNEEYTLTPEYLKHGDDCYSLLTETDNIRTIFMNNEKNKE